MRISTGTLNARPIGSPERNGENLVKPEMPGRGSHRDNTRAMVQGVHRPEEGAPMREAVDGILLQVEDH